MEKTKSKINWKRELKMLPGYLVVIAYVGFMVVMLSWIFGASLSTSREIFTGTVFKFASGFHWENYLYCLTLLSPARACSSSQHRRPMCSAGGSSGAARPSASCWSSP